MNESMEQARQFFQDGLAHSEAGRLEQAQRSFAAALSLAPGRPSVLTNLGATLVRRGRWSDALVLLEEATAVEPDNLQAWSYLAVAHAELGQSRPALRAFGRALEIDPGHAGLWSQRGSLLRELGRLDEAAECFERALALGADGALVGTRFWASQEALVSPRAQERAIQASGDDTIRTQVYDIVRQLDWPAEYDARALGNAFLDTWHGNEAQLSASLPAAVDKFQKAVAAEDFDTAAVLVGEGVGRVRDVPPAADIVHEMVCDATRILNRG